jgi:hypothetical protein
MATFVGECVAVQEREFILLRQNVYRVLVEVVKYDAHVTYLSIELVQNKGKPVVLSVYRYGEAVHAKIPDAAGPAYRRMFLAILHVIGECPTDLVDEASFVMKSLSVA